ncbi:hypothetical protein Q6350_07600 [Isoptericola sp. b515]|uniref:hypothetical protein n=1 Tax=Isoptericola sp. b515 TaxID=3064652 RepID=UPI0027142F20|nr:hypothetical protein [Isoptericola sp. b515]MDO8148294.1 hypothetical protein [Isoptericola sp. b515]
MTRSTRRGVGAVAGAVLLTTMSITGVQAAPGGGGPPHPPGDEGELGANNLSVPTVFVPGAAGSPFGGTCTDGDDSVDPAGTKGVDTDGDGIPDEHLDYWVQGIATWQADCAEAAADTLTVGAEWGDNLQNAPLKAGTPIRVEIGLFADPTAFPMPGYTVVKLDPTLLDRESHYGTLGVEESPYPEVRAWDGGATLDIRTTDGSVVVADEIAYVAEVNSTGRVVYGYNWQKPVGGEYLITVTTPAVGLGATDAGTLSDSDGDGVDDTVTLVVNVGNKGGGNGGGNGGRPADRPRGGNGGQGGGNALGRG